MSCPASLRTIEPSMTYTGSFDELSELTPRICMLVLEPAAPLFEVIVSPAARPWSIWSIVAALVCSMSSALTETTEPVMSLRFIVP